MTFGEALRAWRKARGLSQMALAAKAGLSKATIQRSETGETSPSATTMGKMAAALGIGLSELARGPVPEPGRVADGAGACYSERPSQGSVPEYREVAFVSPWDGRLLDRPPAEVWAVEADLVPHDACLVTYVPDDSMAQELFEGDVILVDPRPAGIPSGCHVVARIGQAIVVRRYLELAAGATFEAYAEGYPPQPARPDQILGLVVAVLESEDGSRTSSKDGTTRP